MTAAVATVREPHKSRYTYAQVVAGWTQVTGSALASLATEGEDKKARMAPSVLVFALREYVGMPLEEIAARLGMRRTYAQLLITEYRFQPKGPSASHTLAWKLRLALSGKEPEPAKTRAAKPRKKGVAVPTELTERIVQTVSEVFGCARENITGDAGEARDRLSGQARNTVYALIYAMVPQISDRSIGEYFGGRDQTSINIGRKRVRRVLKEEQSSLYKQNVLTCLERLGVDPKQL